MGLMTFLRNRAGYILIGAIGFAIVAFLVGDAINVGKPFWAASQKVVGSVDGEEINIDEFGPKVDQSLAQFKQQYGGSGNAQMQAMAVDNVWQGEVANILLTKEFDRLGITVSGEELGDLIKGDNPSPLIVQYFGNPQTGQVDRPQVIRTLKEGLKDPRMAEQIHMLESQIIKQALQQKYTNLIRNSVYVTTLEARNEYENKNKLASFSYVGLDYASIPDASVKLKDADYSQYYDEHKKEFDNPTETRTFEYVSFGINPTKEDSAAVKKQVEKLAEDFKVASNDSLFAAVNSDVKIPYNYIGKGKLDPAVDSAVFSMPSGSFYGPKFTGNSYKLVKVIDTRYSPDSVKASHILLNPSKLGGVDKAKAMADSLKTLVQNGASFADLAKEYSEDGSKEQGGDLGTFSRGQMVAEFENAAFNGSVGDLKIVTTQYGVHLIKIVKQVGSSKVAKLAYIEKNLSPSSKTRDAAYKKASSFLTEANDGNFADLAQKKGYTVGIADKVTPTQGFAPGLDNPRQLIRDAYSASKGDVLDQVYQMDDAYVVAHVTAVKPKGQLSLEDVKKDIEPMVRTSVKAEMLTGKLKTALSGSSGIAQVAQKLGKQSSSVPNIVFANPVIPGLGQENRLIGTVFGMQPGKVSGAIEGESGVYVVSVDGFTSPAPMDNTYKQKETMMQSAGQRSLGLAFQALQDNSDIKDNRVKFY